MADGLRLCTSMTKKYLILIHWDLSKWLTKRNLFSLIPGSEKTESFFQKGSYRKPKLPNKNSKKYNEEIENSDVSIDSDILDTLIVFHLVIIKIWMHNLLDDRFREPKKKIFP